MWIGFSFLCSLGISCYAVRHYVIWCAGKELRDMFGNILFRATEMWPKALPDPLPSFHVLILETDYWRRLRLPAPNTGYSSLDLLSRKDCEIFEYFLKFYFWFGIISNFVHKLGLYLYSCIHVFQIHIKYDRTLFWKITRDFPGHT